MKFLSSSTDGIWLVGWLVFKTFAKLSVNTDVLGQLLGASGLSRENRLLPSSCPTFHVHQRVSHCTDFREI